MLGRKNSKKSIQSYLFWICRETNFYSKVRSIQNEDIIDSLEKLLKKRTIELDENNIQPISIEQFNADIDQSLEDS